MIGVYLLHSEAYYGVGNFRLGIIFSPFYVNLFFFVSGYLLFFKLFKTNKLNGVGYVGFLNNLLFRLVLPSIIFSSLLFVPKMLFHSSEITIVKFIINVFGGVSYWFTSALLISQFVVITLFFIFKKKNIWYYFCFCIVFFFLGWYLNDIRVDSCAESFFPWFWKTGLEYTLIIVLGGVYYRYEEIIKVYNRNIVLVAFVLYVFYIVMSYQGTMFGLMGLGGRCDAMGLLVIIVGIMLVVFISNMIKENRVLMFIGSNSIIFYFLSGLFPAAVGYFAKIFFPNKIYFITILVTLFSLILAWSTTLLINKYMPFLVDIRKLIDGKNGRNIR